MESSVISRAMEKSTMEGSQPRMDPCPRCGRYISGPSLLAHAKAEEYLIGLIGQDHPEWDEPETVPQSAAYYRALVEQTEV